MLDILDYATKKLDQDKYLIDDGVGQRAEDFLKTQDNLAYESYNSHRERLAEAERKVFDHISVTRFLRWPVILIACAIFVASFPSNSVTLIVMGGIQLFVQQLSLNWISLVAVSAIAIFISISVLRLHALQKEAIKRKNEWLQVKNELIQSESFQSFQASIVSFESDLVEIPEQPSPLNAPERWFSESKHFPYLLDQSFAKIRFSQTGLVVKKIEALELIFIYFCFWLIVLVFAVGAMTGWDYFFGSPELPSFTNTFALVLLFAGFSVLALPNTDYNNLQLQLGGLYCDAMYYMDLVSDCFGIDVADARKELIDLLQRDKRFSSVDPEIFTRFDQS